MHYDWYTWLIYIYIYIYIKEIIKKRTKRIFHNILVLTFSLLLQIFRYNVYIYIYIPWLIPLIDTYTMIDTPDWYIHYDWYTLLIHTIHLIDTYTMIDTPDWYIHYDLYPWLIYTVWLIHLIATLWLIHLNDRYTMIHTHDWYKHYEW